MDKWDKTYIISAVQSLCNSCAIQLGDLGIRGEGRYIGGNEARRCRWAKVIWEMSDRRMMKQSTYVLFAAITLVVTSRPAIGEVANQPLTVTFSAMGDVPYKESEYAKWRNRLQVSVKQALLLSILVTSNAARSRVR